RACFHMISECRQVYRVRTGVVLLLFAALLSFTIAPAAAGCPQGWDGPTAAGYCFPPECGKDKSMQCTGKCDRCAGGRLGPHPGEKVLPCTAEGCETVISASRGAVCTCCVRQVNCGILGKRKGTSQSPDFPRTVPKADPCPPKCEVNPDILKRYQKN